MTNRPKEAAPAREGIAPTPRAGAVRFNAGLAGLVLHFGLLMVGLRLVFVLYNWPALRVAGWGETLWAMAHGLRFDAAALTFVLGPAVLLYGGTAVLKGRTLRYVLLGYLVTMSFLVCILFLADLQYFEQTGKHFTYEPVVYLGVSAAPVFRGAFELHPWLSWLSLLGSMGVAVLTWRVLGWWLNACPASPGCRRPRLLLWLPAWLVLGFIAARGGLGRHPLSVGHAMISPNPVLNAVCLNPVYSVCRTGFSVPHRQYGFFDEAHNTGVVRRVVGLGDAAAKRLEYPLLRSSPGTPQGNRKSVVLFLLEGWSARDVSCLGGRPGVTPTFDALARSGLLFTSFQATGVRTAEGVFATLCSFPNQPVWRVLNRPIGWQTRWRPLSQILADAGYHTLFIHGRDLEFDQMDRFLTSAGFETIIDRDDFPPSVSPSDDAWPGYSDEEVMRRADTEFAAVRDAPFFGVVYTMNTHPPFPVPDGFPLMFEPTSVENQFLNALHYADHTLGVFLDLAEKSPYFKETVFLFVSDHGRSGHLREQTGDPLTELHHVPFLIYAPGHVSPGVRSLVASQTDILPTVLGLLELRASHASWGRDLLAETDSDGVAVCINGEQVHWRTNRWLLVDTPEGGRPLLLDLTQQSRGGGNVWRPDSPFAQDLRDNLRAYMSLSQALLYENRVFPRGP